MEHFDDCNLKTLLIRSTCQFKSWGNLSVGQRPMPIFSKGISRNAKIYIMDEATANVDAETDALYKYGASKL